VADPGYSELMSCCMISACISARQLTVYQHDNCMYMSTTRKCKHLLSIELSYFNICFMMWDFVGEAT
jgi:hypothetical protein